MSTDLVLAKLLFHNDIHMSKKKKLREQDKKNNFRFREIWLKKFNEIFSLSFFPALTSSTRQKRMQQQIVFI